MKLEGRKSEKALYLPKAKAEKLTVPALKFITLKGEGNPNDSKFAEYIAVLYSLSYAIKMTLKKTNKPPEGYQDYTVYPLEGIWDINEKAKENYNGYINKDDLVFTLMIRQPDFLTESFYQEMLELTRRKKPHALLDKVNFESIEEGLCVQMLHVGSYDHEGETFSIMESYAQENDLIRLTKTHREIYLSDFRKVPEEKLKTVLRFQVKQKS